MNNYWLGTYLVGEKETPSDDSQIISIGIQSVSPDPNFVLKHIAKCNITLEGTIDWMISLSRYTDPKKEIMLHSSFVSFMCRQAEIFVPAFLYYPNQGVNGHWTYYNAR